MNEDIEEIELQHPAAPHVRTHRYYYLAVWYDEEGKSKCWLYNVFDEAAFAHPDNLYKISVPDKDHA